MEPPTYWASCATGLQFCLRAELEAIEGTDVISDSLAQGGVLFRTNAEPKELAKLRAADNIYAFLGHHQDVPLEKEAAVEYLTSLSAKIDWKSPLELYRRWKQLDETKNCSASKSSSEDKENMDASSSPLTFRVTSDRICKNMMKQKYTSMDAAAAIGDGVNELLGWKASMRVYDVEVLAWIRDMELLIVVALIYSGNKTIERLFENNVAEEKCTTENLPEAPRLSEAPKDTEVKFQRPSRSEAQLHSRRQYRKALVGTSLKPSTSYALLQLAQIKPGHVVLDPMCGCGTIPLEAVDWLGGQIMSIGADNNPKAVDAAAINVRGGGGRGPCDVLSWDAANLPLRSGTIDRVVCDMPFGNRCGNYKVREWLCPKVVKEVVRILQRGTGIAVLMAQSKTMRQEVEVNQKPFLEMLQHILVEMEGLTVDVYVVRRTIEPPPIHEFRPKKANHKRQRVVVKR
ncbi:hypothetical protein MPTK1_7g15140 [Marchantia polymorpha subsp. ruderalis]|uniref:Ribosomal RNA large subunit methyltransferase K/L-like methyltransferase domain-containing protein n=2 Tax=Marchantia polymorpha TaxID=3197 RepID=A0AAF6BZS8_MARPO|nr:hypothetical protein MARPO_0009s0198 [Marchantia polymorpha]BBN17512.1 hypothetical protein Mp_7g15140 [Marchantia polymorpha subsp. ruderalis]|eukprot:PTQ47118.1 hypothetical protein MARPO_0009s0198 [Marchantia polymorpha]